MSLKYYLPVLIVFFVLQQRSSLAQAVNNKYVIIGYIGSHGWTGKDIKASQMTHVIYAFANLGQAGVLLKATPRDSTNLTTLDSVRIANKGFKVLISVGGWGGGRYFSDACLTDSTRSLFIKSAIAFITKYQLDGIDIDWEYPGQIGAGNIFRQADKENFTLLMRDFRNALNTQAIADHHEKYLLTAAMGVDTAYMLHTDVAGVHKYLDYINLMAYDIYNGNDKVTGHQSNLYQSKSGKQERASSADAVQNYIAAGVPANKIVLGVPFYGRGWTEVIDKNRGLYQPSAGRQFSYGYDSIANGYINKNGYKYYWDKKAKVPYLWNAELHTFITYSDERSLKYKVQYIKQFDLAGVMFWEFTLDIRKQNLLTKLDELINN